MPFRHRLYPLGNIKVSTPQIEYSIETYQACCRFSPGFGVSCRQLFALKFDSNLGSCEPHLGCKRKKGLTDDVATCNCECLQLCADECQIPWLVNGDSGGHVIHECFRCKEPCRIHVISWSIADDAEEGLNANTSIETLELIDFERRILSERKREHDSTK